MGNGTLHTRGRQSKGRAPVGKSPRRAAPLGMATSGASAQRRSHVSGSASQGGTDEAWEAVRKGATVLRQGDRGDAVKALQARLNEAGFPCGIVDGIFGKGVERAVKDFQESQGTTPDGVVGKGTAAAFENAPTQEESSAGTDGLKTFHTTYRDWLYERLFEDIDSAFEGEARLAWIEGLLWLTEDVLFRLRGGEMVAIETLPVDPVKGTLKESGGAVPFEWIEPLRELIMQIEQPGMTEGVERSFDARAEGSLYSDIDWNSRLGVPQHRTQSDNLISPEATCNGTSFAMAIERLGIGRDEVVKACEGMMGLPREAAEEEKVAAWKDHAARFMNAENKARKNYLRPRGRKQKAETLGAWSGDFKSSAQMEDLVLLLAFLHGISRYAITSSPGNIRKLLKSIDGQSANNLVTVEKIHKPGSWEELQARAGGCLDQGGAVVFSLFHKGKGSSGSHIITVQQVVPDGFVVDDPYGRIRLDYSHKETGDAYAKKGSRRRVSKNRVDRSGGEDWKLENAQAPESGEVLGRSYKLTRKSVMASFKYMQLLHRPVKLGE